MNLKMAARIVIYVFLACSMPLAIFFFFPADVQYQVTEKYLFSGNQTGDKVFLAVMLPRDNAYQAIDNVEIQWDGEVVREDNRSVAVIKLSGDARNSRATLVYNVILFQGKVKWTSNPEKEEFLPQTNIESDNPVLNNTAQKLCSAQSSGAARKAYRFTAAYLNWPEETRIGTNQSALAAYESRMGVCGEFANLMTALNRACGNPARSISGLSMPMYLPPLMTTDRTWMHPGKAHAWVEVYDGGTWTIADPSWASRMPFDRVWFGRSMGQYLSYGETAAHDHIYREILKWGEEKGEVIGAISAPVKFVSSSEGSGNTVITPVVSVKKGRDPRFIAAMFSFVVCITASSLVERRIANLKTCEAG